MTHNQQTSDNTTTPQETPCSHEKRQTPSETTLFGKKFTAQEEKTLFLYLIIGIVLVELAITVGALVFSITNSHTGEDGMPRFNFPWIGYLVSVVLAPAVIMLLVHLVRLGFSRSEHGDAIAHEAIPERMQTFYALVRGAPTVILLAGLILMGAAIYYFDGVMAFLLKIGDAFQTIALWVVGGFAAAWIISYCARLWFVYKTKQMEAEYAFRQEVLQRTGMIILDTKHAPTTALTTWSAEGTPQALPEGTPSLPPALQPECPSDTGHPTVDITPYEKKHDAQ